MARVHRQNRADILQRRAVHICLIKRRGPCVVSLGKFRRMVDQRREMLDRGLIVASRHGRAPPRQQQIHSRRSRFRPFRPNLRLDRFERRRIRGLEVRKQLIQTRSLDIRQGRAGQKQQGCRDGRFEYAGQVSHIEKTSTNSACVESLGLRSTSQIQERDAT